MEDRGRFLLSLVFISLGLSHSPQDIARNIEKRLSSLVSLQADFEQVYYPVSLSTPLREKGRLYFRKPDLMRWEYREPEQYVYLYKEGLLLHYAPEDNQLFRHALTPEEKSSQLFAILLGRARLEDGYLVERAEFPSGKTSLLQVKLTPKEEGEYAYILLGAEEKTWLISQLVLFDPAGNKQEFHFSQVKPNPRLTEKIFELEVPPDCEIIDDLPPQKKN